MLRPTLQQLARLCGRAASRRHAGLRFLQHPPQTAFDLALLQHLPDLPDVKFIQVGANDGRRADPLAGYLARYPWSGLMFEPLKANFADLQRLRGASPNFQLRRAAIDVTAGRRLVYDLAPAATAGLPDWTRGLGSFSRERVAQAARELGLPDTAILSEEVEAITWSQVWQEFGPRRCDLLVIDTEGYDLTLLRAAGLAEHRPRLIHFEHACVGPDDRLAFYRELIDLGYEIATDGPDTTAWLKS